MPAIRNRSRGADFKDAIQLKGGATETQSRRHLDTNSVFEAVRIVNVLRHEAGRYQIIRDDRRVAAGVEKAIFHPDVEYLGPFVPVDGRQLEESRHAGQPIVIFSSRRAGGHVRLAPEFIEGEVLPQFGLDVRGRSRGRGQLRCGGGVPHLEGVGTTGRCRMAELLPGGSPQRFLLGSGPGGDEEESAVAGREAFLDGTEGFRTGA